MVLYLYAKKKRKEKIEKVFRKGEKVIFELIWPIQPKYSERINE